MQLKVFRPKCRYRSRQDRPPESPITTPQNTSIRPKPSKQDPETLKSTKANKNHLFTEPVQNLIKQPFHLLGCDVLVQIIKPTKKGIIVINIVQAGWLGHSKFLVHEEKAFVFSLRMSSSKRDKIKKGLARSLNRQKHNSDTDHGPLAEGMV